MEGFRFHGKDFMLGLCGDLWDEPKRFKAEGLLIWPVYVNYSEEQWQEEMKEYAAQAKLAAKDVCMINSISEEPASVGGAFYFEDGSLVNEPVFGVENILIVGYDDVR